MEHQLISNEKIHVYILLDMIQYLQYFTIIAVFIYVFA